MFVLIRDLRIFVECKCDGFIGEFFDQFGGMMFKDGYFYKYVFLKIIDVKGIEFLFDELQRFQKLGEDGVDDLGFLVLVVKNCG